MELSPSEIRSLADLGKTLASAPVIEDAVATAFEALHQILGVSEIGVVYPSEIGRWSEWIAGRGRVRQRTLRKQPTSESARAIAYFESADSQIGFVWARPRGSKTQELLDLIAPQMWTSFMLRTALDRANRSARSESATIRGTLEVRDEERRRIARELHDDLGQSMASLKLNLKFIENMLARREGMKDAVAELAGARTEVGAMLEKTRDLSHTLYPRILDTLGLSAAIKELLHQTERHSGMHVSWSLDGRERKLPKEAAAGLYRCAQEAINNALRHSGASEIHVTLAFGSSDARLQVEDNGKGFDPTTLSKAGTRLMSTGFWTIRQRMRALGGAFRLSTGVGRGTLIETVVPIEAKNGRRKKP